MSGEGSIDFDELRSESEVREFHETVLEDLDEAEHELVALLDDPEANREELRDEIHSLFGLTKRFVRRSEEYEAKLIRHAETVKGATDRTEAAQDRVGDVLDDLGIDDQPD